MSKFGIMYTYVKEIKDGHYVFSGGTKVTEVEADNFEEGVAKITKSYKGKAKFIDAEWLEDRKTRKLFPIK